MKALISIFFIKGVDISTDAFPVTYTSDDPNLQDILDDSLFDLREYFNKKDLSEFSRVNVYIEIISDDISSFSITNDMFNFKGSNITVDFSILTSQQSRAKKIQSLGI